MLVTTVPRGIPWLTPDQEVAPQTTSASPDSVITMSAVVAVGSSRLHSSARAFPSLETPLTNARASPVFQSTLSTVSVPTVLIDMPTRRRRLVPVTVCDQVKVVASAGVQNEAASDGGTGVDVAVAVGVGVAVEVAVGVGVEVAVEVAVGVGVAVDVAVTVGVGVEVAVGHTPPGHGVAVAVGVGVAQLVPPVAIRTDPKVSGWNPVASLWTPPP